MKVILVGAAKKIQDQNNLLLWRLVDRMGKEMMYTQTFLLNVTTIAVQNQVQGIVGIDTVLVVQVREVVTTNALEKRNQGDIVVEVVATSMDEVITTEKVRLTISR